MRVKKGLWDGLAIASLAEGRHQTERDWRRCWLPLPVGPGGAGVWVLMANQRPLMAAPAAREPPVQGATMDTRDHDETRKRLFLLAAHAGVGAFFL